MEILLLYLLFILLGIKKLRSNFVPLWLRIKILWCFLCSKFVATLLEFMTLDLAFQHFSINQCDRSYRTASVPEKLLKAFKIDLLVNLLLLNISCVIIITIIRIILSLLFLFSGWVQKIYAWNNLLIFSFPILLVLLKSAHTYLIINKLCIFEI